MATRPVHQRAFFLSFRTVVDGGHLACPASRSLPAAPAPRPKGSWLWPEASSSCPHSGPSFTLSLPSHPWRSRLLPPLPPPLSEGLPRDQLSPKPRAWMLEARWILSESQISTRWRPKRPRHCSPRPPHFLRILRFLRMMLLSSVDGKQSLGVTLDAYCLSSRPCWVTPPGCCHHHFFPVLLLFRTS